MVQRRLRYEEPQPTSRVEAEVVFRSEDSEAICRTLVGVAFHDPDRRWVEDWCLKFCDSPNADVRSLTVTCLGHLARIHRELDLQRVLPVLRRLSADPEIAGYVEDAMDDLKLFLRPKLGDL